MAVTPNPRQQLTLAPGAGYFADLNFSKQAEDSEVKIK